MKNLILIFSLVVTVYSCSQNKENSHSENSIYGTWQLIERTANNYDGTINNWEQIENGYKITFNEDFSYESEISPSECNEISNSSFVIVNESSINTIEITINCNNPDISFESKDYYTFEDSSHLILNPIEPACPEGCSFKYKKIE